MRSALGMFLRRRLLLRVFLVVSENRLAKILAVHIELAELLRARTYRSGWKV